MSALPPIATAKADFDKPSCLLYPQKRTCAAQPAMSALGQKQTFALQYSVSAGRSWLTINPNRWMSALFLRPRLWHRRRKPVRSCYLLRQTVVDVWSDFFFKRGSQHSVFASTTRNSFRRQIALQGNIRESRRIRAEG